MFTIRKIHKFQPYFYNEKLGSGQTLGDLVHEDPAIPKSGVDVARLQINRKLHGTLHDIYTIPEFDNIGDVYAFVSELEGKNIGESFTDFKKGIERDLVLAYKLAIKYLAIEGYYVPKMGKEPISAHDLERIFHKGQKFTQVRDKIAYCTILKEVLGFFRVIRYPHFRVNYETGEIDFQNNEFVEEVMGTFNREPFYYNDEGSKQLSSTSREMKGYTIIDGMKIEFDAGFGVKSLYALIEKMDGQMKYNLPEAFKDIHRMRIEVKTPEEVIRMGKVIYTNFGEGLEIENVGGIISHEVFNDYANSYLVGESYSGFRVNLERTLTEKAVPKKSYSEDRSELKITRRGVKPIEIQIVLVNNTNETGYAHHDVYKIRRKIVAKIRRHGWIGINGIRTIISMVFEKNTAINDGKCTIPFSEEQIFQHILSVKGFLVGVRGATEEVQHEHGKEGKLKIKHYTTREVIEKYQRNYPNATRKNPISIRTQDENLGIEALVPISQISFPSTSSTSLQPPLPGL